ncbi:Ig-like domain repeat protein [Rhodococcus sp. ABRD24]|uniref:beta strand repeat-containing protein n=1 Tax=Rhodococcus sp. ABRD24 TaxID=2507582 RepID=UPI0013F1594A|nr:Ig-like domain repeat protein [Rhodococcus sp. ABRD24]
MSGSTNSGSWTFNRTISNGTPVPGETITVTNNIRWNGGLAPTISAFKDIHPACLTYVANSSRVSGKGVGTDSSDPTVVRMTGSWIRSAVDRNIDYTVQYTVGQNCARDVALTTGAGISANQGTGSETANAGPSITVAKSATTTSLTVSPVPQVDSVSTLTATVSGGVAGVVEFSNNGVVLGTGTAVDGVATYSWTPGVADAGQSFSVIAKYLGDASNAASVSVAQTGTVAAAPAVPAAPSDVVVSPAAVVVGDTVTVSGKAEAGSSVVVTAGGQTCSATADVGGVFSCDVVVDVVGSVSVTAVASNGVGSGPASVPVSVEVSKRATATSLTVSPVPQVDSVSTLTATVSGGVAGVVEFSNNGVVLGTGTAVDGVATYSWTPGVADAGQSFSVIAKYLGDASNAASVSVAQTGTVAAAPAVPAAPSDVVVSPAAVVVGDTVTVSGKAEAGSSVVVTAGGQTCSATADVGGVFSCDVVVDVVGSVSVTAVASNGVGSGPASVPVSVEVSKRATATSLTVSPVPQVDSVSTLTATVSGGVAGVVEFSNNGVVLGTGTAVDGVATYSWTPGVADAGQSFSVIAKYLGDASNAASVSVAQTGTVAAAPVGSVVIAVNPAAPISGAPSAITVTGADTGTDVTIKVGAETICTATVTADGTATCTWTPTAAGSQVLTVDVTVGGTANTVTKVVTVEAEEVPGSPTGSLGSLAGLLGSS